MSTRTTHAVSNNSSAARRPLEGLSLVRGSISDPLWDLTIPDLLISTAQRWPDNEVAVFCQQNLRRTYRQFTIEVDKVAQGLRNYDIGPGDRVGVWSPNRYEWVLTQFACARIGAILVCINPAYRLLDLEYALNKVACKALVTARSFKGSDYGAMLQELCPELAALQNPCLQAERVPSLCHVFCMGNDVPAGMIGFDRFLDIGQKKATVHLDRLTAGLSCHDPINIQFTSGTTGNPKGACLTHHNILNNARFVTDCILATAADRICIPVPFYHCFGMGLGALGCVTKGATMVVPGESFNPAETLQTVSDEQCTSIYGVPTMFVSELAVPAFDTFDLSSLKTGIMGGALCPIETMRAVREKMNMTGVTIIYGMTETSPISFQSNQGDPVEKLVTTVGRVQPHVEVKIIGKDGKILPVGRQGEILTRGYSVMQGYWNDPEKTAETIDKDGWMHTGDIGVLDGDGFCSITGRIKDLIIRGGENIYPREIEDFLFAQDMVLEAQVFGIPDERLGEVVCAWIVPKSDEGFDLNALKAVCEAQLAHFKVPAHMIMKSSLPMTVTGKPQKFIMREEMMKELVKGNGTKARRPSKTG